ncbi:aminotransferase class I/II-fold pyridoxal phosphate-dependent enzyme [Rudanella paleaurantiibacter]|uniref:Aminotransferase class I/II-fold pyridoxal phosphate-dependent enzyme n=1 Tax=Rudanella paleaurantiibacter TaxID=2614655 RepID=A0A7J5U2M7_9BACT|nr:aminotransferase class I/II-fold pyridoxal phosphate-dependent enzyme [Rudanella paleaurantiibacter]KAB7732053.1 aminotransferase class I/II-fold pyridoxal phosphate-dependent enzyme [Rudanella paleaurantiibacter]
MNPDTHLTIDQLPGRYVTYARRQCLFFSGTSYLGLSQNPAFQARVIQAMSQYGTVFGSSRNGNLRLRVYEEAEQALALWTSAPAALTVSSGMMAGQVVMQYLATNPDTVFMYGPHTHPALWHRTAVPLPQQSFDSWVADLPAQVQQQRARPLVLAMNSLDAVRSVAYSFDWVRQLPHHPALTLVVDDSHGIGVRNRGIWAELSAQLPASVRLVVTASLAKAMGLPGGLVLADSVTVEGIRHTSFFGGASPMAPAPLAAFAGAEELYAEAQVRLARLVTLAEEVLLPTGLFRQAPHYPVFYTEHDELYAHALRHDLFIYSFAYPTPRDKANTRIVISAFHEPADIERLGEVVQAFGGR